MIMFKKYMHSLISLLIIAMSCANIDARNSVTKKSIQKAKQAQQFRRAINTQQVTVRNRTPFANTQGQRRVVIMQRGPVKKSVIRSVGSKASQLPKQQSTMHSSIKDNSFPVAQKQNEQSISNNSVIQKTNVLENKLVSKEPSSVPSLIKNGNESLNGTKHLLDNTSVVSPQEKIVVEEKNDAAGQQSAIQDNQDNQNDNVVIEHQEEIEFLKAFSKVPLDKLDQELDKLNFNDAQKEAIKKALAQLPKAIKNVDNELQDPDSLAGQSMQGKGWLEYFRSDILNHSWVKTGASWARTVWDCTGGAVLEKCGLASKETIKEYTDISFDGFFQFIEQFLESIGLNTPGGVLDNVLVATLHSYFPKENTWSNAFAQMALAIGYYGAIRGLTKQTMIWKTMEAFLCTSYCKYFMENNSDYLRQSFLQRPINFFYHYIPDCVKNGWIEWYMSKNVVVGFAKHVTSLVGVGRMLAHAVMNNTQQPKVIG